jgi:hypothetical protein
VAAGLLIIDFFQQLKQKKEQQKTDATHTS